VLSDAAATELRNLFAAETDILSPAIASRLKTWLEHHMALRPFYPEIERFYAAAAQGRLIVPLPMDAVEGFTNIVTSNTPRFFEPNVIEGLTKAERPPLNVDSPVPDELSAGTVILPPMIRSTRHRRSRHILSPSRAL
jgi:hypothetical protein